MLNTEPTYKRSGVTAGARRGDKVNQTDKIKRHLETFGRISSREAYEEYGIMRLGARIWELRHEHGMNIEKTMKSALNRFGEPAHYAEYKVVA